MVKHMVSNIKIAIFAVGAILSAVVPIYILLKVRKKPGIMKPILTGAILSFVITLAKGLLVTLLAGIMPSLFTQSNVLSGIILLFGLEAASLLGVYWFSMRFLKEDRDKLDGAGMALGYLLTFTWTNISTLINFVIGSFAINMGNLDEYLTPDQVQAYIDAIVHTSAVHYLAFALYIIFSWLVYSKLFTLSFNREADKKKIVGLVLLIATMTVLFSTKIMNPVALLAIIGIITLLFINDFKKTWK